MCGPVLFPSGTWSLGLRGVREEPFTRSAPFHRDPFRGWVCSASLLQFVTIRAVKEVPPNCHDWLPPAVVYSGAGRTGVRRKVLLKSGRAARVRDPSWHGV